MSDCPGVSLRILKVFDGDYPWDVRVEKIVKTLLDRGHSVRLVCRNRKARPRYERLADGLEICRLSARLDSLSTPFCLNPIWISALLWQIARFRPHRLLVRDLPLSPLALAAGRLTGIPVIADLAEPYPASLRSQWHFERMSAVDRVVRNPYLAELAERVVVRAVDRVLVVCPEAGHRLEGQGLSAGRWTEVGNTVTLDSFTPRGELLSELSDFNGRFVLLFSGLIAGDRGLDVALDALAILRHRQPGRFALVVVGAERPTVVHRRSSVRAELEQRAARLGLDGDIRFTGWIDHGRLPDVIRRAQIGLLPFRACEHINSTLANKLFEYMTLGLPVIASDIPPMARVLNETGAGITFRTDDAADLADKIERLAKDPQAQARCAAAGRAATNEVYNWKIDGRRLLRAVENPDSVPGPNGV
jgi:glycosyltransferase involved in cell wall biosynthesis